MNIILGIVISVLYLASMGTLGYLLYKEVQYSNKLKLDLQRANSDIVTLTHYVKQCTAYFNMLFAPKRKTKSAKKSTLN